MIRLRRSSLSLRLAIAALILGSLGAAACGPKSPAREEDAGAPDASDSGSQGCVAGTAGCACVAGGTCTVSGIVCDSTTSQCRAAATCSEAHCVTGQYCALASSGGYACSEGSCEPGFQWSSGSKTCVRVSGASCSGGLPSSIATDCAALHRECVTTAASAQCGACSAGFVARGSECVPAATCDEAMCDRVHRACESTASGPQCGACLPDFELVGGECVVDPACADCSAAHRVCTDDGSGVFSCGDCDVGYVNNGGQCELPPSCQDLDCAAQHRTCSEAPSAHCDDACVAGYSWNPATSLCEPTTSCPSGQGWNGTSCIVCAGGAAVRACDTNGGEIDMRLATSGGYCICATQPGYFVNQQTYRASPCDQDGDGWVTDQAIDSIEHTERVYRENARCSLRTIDRVLLVPEGSARVASASRFVTLAQPLPLYESPQNDGQTFAGLPAHVGYPGDVAFPRTESSPHSAWDPRTINSLTKACVSANEDVNDNGLYDVEEGGGLAAVRALSTNGKRYFTEYTRFAYFVELHDGWFIQNIGEQYGAYVIRERSRDAATPSHVSLAPPAGEYWNTCTRHTDRDYQAAANTAPVAPRRAGGDLTEFNVGGWQGMVHHSQLKCVLVSSESDYKSDPTHPTAATAPSHVFSPDATNLGPNTVARAATYTSYNPVQITIETDASVWPGLPWTLHGCRLDSVAPIVPSGVGVSTVNPRFPVFACGDAIPVAADANRQAVWAVVGFEQANSDTYYRGCINECKELTKAACPQFDASVSDRVACDPGPTDFGRLVCGCNAHYAGVDETTFDPTCELACADPYLHLSSGFDYRTRAGYWLCGDIATSVTVAGAVGGYSSFSGYVPSATTDGTIMSGDAGGATYTIRNP